MSGPFDQVWVDQIQEIHAPISDAGFSRMSLPGGTAIWPREIVLSLREYRPYKIDIVGVTDEATRHVVTLYLDDHDDYPEDLAQLIPELIEAARNCPGGAGMKLGDGRLPASAYAIGPHGLAALLDGPSGNVITPHPTSAQAPALAAARRQASAGKGAAIGS